MSKARSDKKYTYFNTVTQDMIEAILEDIKQGGSIKHSARANNLSERHFHNLVAQGIVDIDCGNQDTLQAKLVRSLSRVQLNEIKSCRQAILNSDKSHKGAEWTLEHAYWREYGNNAESKELAEEIDKLKELVSKGKDNDKEMDSGDAYEERCAP